MKNDYNKIMKEEIDSILGKKKLLLHVCCAPCSSACLNRLSSFDITLFYYNPNTFPKSEYDLRFEQFKKLTNLNIIKVAYSHKDFLDNCLKYADENEGGERCKKCIELRLKTSFEFAKNNGYDYITTTLTTSPHKDATFINEKGKEFEKIYGVKFLPCDFKKENGFLNSIKISKEKNLYRQDYCGCEFSLKNKEKNI